MIARRASSQSTLGSAILSRWLVPGLLLATLTFAGCSSNAPVDASGGAPVDASGGAGTAQPDPGAGKPADKKAEVAQPKGKYVFPEPTK
jgi:hypothetical protein